jgi:hypothetical protein
MIKCLECGFEADRLQWTHFKYNCTGRFKNGTEYKNAYPNALVVSPKLAGKTAITLDNFILKYGTEEGTLRWNSYRDKQAASNKFEYKNKKFGWTKEQFDDYNSSRAQTLEKMIIRYGEKIGIEKWHSYCERHAYTNTLEYFTEKYGREDGFKKYKEINKEKATSVNPTLLAEQLNISVEDAVEIILSRRESNLSTIWGSNLEKDFTNNIEILLDEKLEYTSFTRPFGKWSHALNSYVIYDIKHNNCIIEFNGDYWHANPKIYRDDAMIRGRTAVEIWERDLLKMQLAEELGFRTYVVWESEYKRDKQNIISEVVRWIRNGQK